MPSVHGEDAVIRILDKESISEQFTELRLDILGLPGRRAEALPQVHRRAVRHGARHRARPAAARRRRSTRRCRRSSRSRTRSSRSRIRSSTSCAGITQIPINEKKGLTFARGLRSILRHDPDKIMVGEIRDTETAQIAINSALTGHLVFTTVHANNVLDVLGRFLNMGVEAVPVRLGAQLRAGAAPRAHHLRRTASGRRRSTRALLEESGLDPALAAQHAFYEGAGCIECGGTGYKGRTAICELLDLTDRIREMILEKRPTSEIKKAAREEGMRFLRESAVEQVMLGRDDAARNQQGDVRRMSLPAVVPRERPARRSASRSPPTACRRRRAARQARRHAVVAAHAAEPLPAGALVPSLTARNVARPRGASSAALRSRARAARRAAAPRRAGRARPGGEGVAACGSSRCRRARGPRSAGPLAGAQGGAVPDRGGAGRPRCPARRLDGRRTRVRRDRSRGATSSTSTRALCADAGAHAGLVDLATFNVINAVLAAAGAPAPTGDWLLVHVAADYATLAILRGRDLIFFRTAAPTPTATWRISCTRRRCTTKIGSAAAASRASCWRGASREARRRSSCAGAALEERLAVAGRAARFRTARRR